MKAYVLRSILGLAFLAGIGAETLAQCTSLFSFGAASVPVTSLDSVVFSPCILFGDFATISSLQAGQTYAITTSVPSFVSIYKRPTQTPLNLVISGIASNTISFLAPISGDYEVVFYADATCSNANPGNCQTPRVACTSCPSPIEIDSCANAALVTGGTVAFTTINATGMDVSSCTSGDSLDVWVRYSPPTSGTVGIETCGSGFNTSLQIFDGCPCDGGNELACNDNHFGSAPLGGLSCSAVDESSIQMWMDASSVYYIRLSGAGGTRGTGRFSIIDPVLAGGELCSSPLLLEDGVTINTDLSTFGGSFSSQDQLCSSGGSNLGMFFRIPVARCGEVDIAISHTASRFNWFLLGGECNNLTTSSNPGTILTSGCALNAVNFRDQALWLQSSTPGSRSTFPQEYILFVEASGTEGPLSVTYNLRNSSPSPAHDDCDSAYVLGPGDGFSALNSPADAHSSSVSCANTDASDNNASTSVTPTSGCFGGAISWQNSLWYEWTAPASLVYTLELFNQMCVPSPLSSGNGLEFMVTTIKDCKDPARTSSGAVTDVSGNSCYSTGTTGDISFTFSATANTTYYILIDGYDAAMCDFDMLLSENALLPAELYSFEGEATPNGNLLEWKFETQPNQFLSFDVQRSVDGAFFETVGNVWKSAESNYTFLDERAPSGQQYYRLKLHTIEGRLNYSHIIEIYNQMGAMALYAQDAGQSLQVLLGLESVAVRLEILTVTGQQVYFREWSADAAREQYVRPELASGVYLYRLSTQTKQQSGKFIKH